jgi:hypothetical protein
MNPQNFSTELKRRNDYRASLNNSAKPKAKL